MEEQAVESFVADDATLEYLGQWHRLVSTTNWEKGRIILEWRQALIANEALATDYSDDAWSRRVGNVSSQHVGRLRRVYERFGDVRSGYRGLFWSHFASAVEWQDAEMWLEGAVQNDWSVSQMRYQRWEVLGKPADEQPSDEFTGGEVDEDALGAENTTPETLVGKEHVIRDVPGGPDYNQGPDFGDDVQSAAANDEGVPFDYEGSPYPQDNAAETVAPLAHLPRLPDDMCEAFESFKLSIVRHKLAGWNEVSQDDVLTSLDGLKRLALSPRAD